MQGCGSEIHPELECSTYLSSPDKKRMEIEELILKRN